MSACAECESLRASIFDALVDLANAESMVRLSNAEPCRVPDPRKVAKDHLEAKSVYEKRQDALVKHRLTHRMVAGGA